jgi:hypothetical protein
MSTSLGNLRIVTYVATRWRSRQLEALMHGLPEMSMASATMACSGADKRGGAQT